MIKTANPEKPANHRILLIGLVFFFMSPLLQAQDLGDFLESQMESSTEYAFGTFKTTRILNGHSVEQSPLGQLDFRISHRFGRINTGAYEFFGLDIAHIHLSLEYGIRDWLQVGIGRGTYEKTVDGFIKAKLLRQSSGQRSMPVTLSAFAGTYVNGLRQANPEFEFRNRMAYVGQVLVARKFGDRFSLQFSPAFLHRDLVEPEFDPENLVALGGGGRLKLTNRISFNAEYYYIWYPGDQPLTAPLHHPLSLGFDIETGGHVFQIIVTNSVAMRENGIIGGTTGTWRNGDIHLGFNISRVFQLTKEEMQ